mmetsp:Transcript_9082/g.17774  ORF Transcript_9082/g.17774 Transcript_9082/m.17774 type:complete len:366 (-) Transcript_9082:2539-3636(-)
MPLFLCPFILFPQRFEAPTAPLASWADESLSVHGACVDATPTGRHGRVSRNRALPLAVVRVHNLLVVSSSSSFSSLSSCDVVVPVAPPLLEVLHVVRVAEPVEVGLVFDAVLERELPPVAVVEVQRQTGVEFALLPTIPVAARSIRIAFEGIVVLDAVAWVVRLEGVLGYPELLEEGDLLHVFRIAAASQALRERAAPEALEHPDALLRELVDEVAHDDEHEDADEEDEVWQSAPVVQPVEHSQQGNPGSSRGLLLFDNVVVVKEIAGAEVHERDASMKREAYGRHGQEVVRYVHVVHVRVRVAAQDGEPLTHVKHNEQARRRHEEHGYARGESEREEDLRQNVRVLVSHRHLDAEILMVEFRLR